MVRTPLLLSLPGSCIGTLVGELRSRKLCGTAKKSFKKWVFMAISQWDHITDLFMTLKGEQCFVNFVISPIY